MESLVVRRSKRIASTKKPTTVNPEAKRSRISRNHNEIIIENSSMIDHFNLVPSKMNSNQKRSHKSKPIEPIAETGESVSSIISASNSTSSNGAKGDINGLEILINSPLETCGSVTVKSIMPLRRSKRIAIRYGTCEQPVSNQNTNRSTKVISDFILSSKKEPTIKHDSASNKKTKAVIAPTVFNEGEIVMAKMSGHIIWPAKVIETQIFYLKIWPHVVLKSFFFVFYSDFGHQ